MTWQLSRKDNLYNDLATEKIKDLDLNELKNIVKQSIEGINGIIDDEKFDIKKSTSNIDSKKTGKKTFRFY